MPPAPSEDPSLKGFTAYFDDIQLITGKQEDIHPYEWDAAAGCCSCFCCSRRDLPCRACAHAPVLVPLFYTPLDFGSAHVFPITRTQHQAQARARAEAEGQAECAESVTRSGRHMPPFVNAEGERERVRENRRGEGEQLKQQQNIAEQDKHRELKAPGKVAMSMLNKRTKPNQTEPNQNPTQHSTAQHRGLPTQPSYSHPPCDMRHCNGYVAFYGFQTG